MGNKWRYAHLGGELYRLVGGDNADPTVLEDAAEAVDHDREAKYGHPLDDFTATAAYWTTHLRHKYGIDVTLEAEDVAVMMVHVKMSREAVSHGRDNLVDGAGYLRTLERVIEERARRLQAGRRPPPPSEWIPGPDGDQTDVTPPGWPSTGRAGDPDPPEAIWTERD